MIKKVVGYGGFTSYGELPYANLKPGKSELSPNQVWESTTRQQDHLSVYQNYHYKSSQYEKKIASTVHPKDYQDHSHVKKGVFLTTSSNIMDQTNGGTLDQTNDKNFLVSGVEHWNSNYNASIVDPYAKSQATRPDWSLNGTAFYNHSQMGISQYKTQLGQKGHQPTEQLDETGNVKPEFVDSLKEGTTQVTQHIPNYTGFIPTATTLSQANEHSKAENPRNVFSQISILDNQQTPSKQAKYQSLIYQFIILSLVQIPGYAGHKPAEQVNLRGELREKCFETVSTLKF